MRKRKTIPLSIFLALGILLALPFNGYLPGFALVTKCYLTQIGPNAPQKIDYPPGCEATGGSVPGCDPGPADAKEPPDDYTRTTINGSTVNARTLFMIKEANRFGKAMGVPEMFVTQGSYNKGGVAASKGTHNGGGAIDVSVLNLKGKVSEAVQALRMAGFAAWERLPLPGVWPHHIHAIAIGDKEMSTGPYGAAPQVVDYFIGKNGLAGHANDNTPHPVPGWAAKYGKCTYAYNWIELYKLFV